MGEDDQEEKDKDLADVMAQEKSRGRRRNPIDPEERRKRDRLHADLIRALRARDERKFLRLLRESGWKDESPEFANALKLFRAASAKH